MNNWKCTYLAAAVAVTLSACGGGSQQDTTPGSARLAMGAAATKMGAGNGVTAASYEFVVQQLYVAFFGRPADSGGLANFSAALLAAGAPTDIAGLGNAYSSNATVKSLVDGFGTSDESAQLYGKGTTTDFITAVYKSVFNRKPDPDGQAYWVGALDRGELTRGNAALSVMAGAVAPTNNSSQGLLDGLSVRNKIAAASQFTSAMLAPVQTNGYRGQVAAAAARAMVSAVDAGTDMAAYQATVTATLRKMSYTALVAGGTLQWNVTTASAVQLTDAAGAAVDISGLTCAADDPASLSVAADCSSVQAKRLGNQNINISGPDLIATATVKITPQRQPFGSHGMSQYTNLVVNSGGTAQGWGNNSYGVLAIGNTVVQPLPVSVRNSAGTGVWSGIASMSLGENNGLGLTDDGQLWSWGDWYLSDNKTSYLPQAVPNAANNGSLQHIVEAEVGGHGNASMLADDGTVYAWGYYNGVGPDVRVRYPAQVTNPSGKGVLSNIASISVGSGYTIALAADGKVYGWGWNPSGQTGRGTTTQVELLPAAVLLAADNSPLNNVVAISAGYNFALALTADGQVYAWGDDSNGQLGQGSTNNKGSRAVLVKAANGNALSGIKMIAAGGWHALALDNDGNVYSWGSATSGQLGDGSNRSAGNARTVPGPVVGSGGTGQLGGVVSIAAGFTHSLALASNGNVYIWGAGFGNGLGQGGTSTADKPVPTPVKNADGSAALNLGSLAAYGNLLKRGR